MVKAVIFDMDGVIIDSEGLDMEVKQALLKEFKLKISKKKIIEKTGETARDFFAYVNKLNNTNFDVEMLIERKMSLQRKIFRDKLRLFPYVKEFLRELKKNKVKIALASSSRMEKIEFVLNLLRLRGKFDVIVSADDVKKGKPNPEIFLKAAKRLRIKPKDCVVIEDSVHGVRAAKRAKMYCIGVTNTFSRDKLKEADLVVESLREVSV
ncbi:MAG: HAD family phosphatase [Candidatus Woesearchaeota archaeon]|jgi:beta-phosphoglucomutase family hydrolase|nr:HAD family phosphatase [Candidatus Woesearchaeota archaeon]MDP7506200.1 HAD family phosphatase [Candidatus Woesearchaeota archaeon]MDP7610731.1 HAD family phosphatase [Candidatus Woesearchaeota archaeon]|tara:strand:- start:194 stop:820 length:627 start_codon:yes stop_codon:yes gene_type:complete